MTRNNSKPTPRRVLLWSVAMAVLALAASSVQGAAQAPIYGLWRDQSGGLWCGGTCGEGQACCTITPVQPAPAP
jgi:hypothetical protein